MFWKAADQTPLENGLEKAGKGVALVFGPGGENSTTGPWKALQDMPAGGGGPRQFSRAGSTLQSGRTRVIRWGAPHDAPDVQPLPLSNC